MAAAQTSCDCRRAIRASGETAIPSWLASIIPPPCRHKAHSSHRGHVLRGNRWQLLSSVIITHSQTSWNKDATKDPVEMGPAMPRAHTYERAMKHHAQVCTISHLDSESRTPHWLARRKWVKNRDRDTKMIDFKRFLKKTQIVYAGCYMLLWCAGWLLGCTLLTEVNIPTSTTNKIIIKT